jgi:hypothetical protein
VLTPFDDFPVHQTPEPIAQPSSGDRNVYDRYFFNGYALPPIRGASAADGELYFAAAWGLYPNRSVQDAAFSVVRGGEQVSVHASRRAPVDRVDMRVGPINVEVVEPLRRLRVTVGPNESGVEADVTFTNTTVPMQEPRFTRHAGTRVVMDYTRLTQFGAWEGWVSVDGERIQVAPSEVFGSRDRSWGIRGVGERDAGAPGFVEPQFFWLWAPISFDDTCVHFDVQEDGDGRRWHWNGELAPVGADTSERAVAVDWEIDWKRGTRRAERAAIVLHMLDGADHRVELEPILDFQMLGIGYMHPEYGHGTWKGEEAVMGERWKLADLDPMAFPHLHVQALCRATWGERTGVGILEQLVIGRHLPSGFTELLDAAR